MLLLLLLKICFIRFDIPDFRPVLRSDIFGDSPFSIQISRCISKQSQLPIQLNSIQIFQFPMRVLK